MRAGLLLGGLGLILAVVNVSIVRKERLLDEGRVVLVELAPVDPRSLIQGDYMQLDYAIGRTRGNVNWPRSGRMVVTVDGRGVASFDRIHEGEPLRQGELLLAYKRRSGRIRIGSDAFFFQEKRGPVFENAKYGELRVADDGSSVLVGLRDADLRPLR